MILIIEDNVDVNQMLATTLQDAGYQTKSVYNGIDGSHEAKKQEYELVLLDLMLPYKSGDQILTELRTVSNKPVIILSAKDLVRTKVDLLRLGADDYITKPFDLEELVARVEANLRKKKIYEEKRETFTYKDIILDHSSKRVNIKEEEVELTKKEYEMLALFIMNPTKIFTKANLFESVWEEEFLGDDNAIKTHLSNLRAKLKKYSDEEYIETVRGLGYRLQK